MKCLSVISARCTWLFNLNELNPKGLRLFPQLTDALTEAYDFDDQPDDAPLEPGTDKAQPGLKFKNGQFEIGDGAVRVALELYDDGIIGESAVSTEVTSLFLQHAIDWATKSFELTFDHQLITNRIHGSEVVVQFSSRLSEALQPLSAFADLLSETAFSRPLQNYFPSGVTFEAAGGGAPFTIEKRANTPSEATFFIPRL